MSPLSVTSGPTGSGSLARAFVHDFLPVFAIAAGLLAAIWLACAIIATVGAYLGLLVFHGVCTLTRTVIRWIRRRWASEYAHLVTVNADGVTTTSVNPRCARRWHAQPPTPDDIPRSSDGRSTP
ncbi:hypothetical protein [Lentzea sp. E54]|uniref:hypothetical protein n=1 Tax=Lentzea xerophila TaxID=3435883 RepID=UPI003DA68736